MDTLLLSIDQWDLTENLSGNIAVTTGAYAIAQDVASAIKTFLGEVYYDTTQGIPYFENELGHPVSNALIESDMSQAALTVPGVVQAQTTLLDMGTDRVLHGTVKVIDTAGQELNVTF